MSWKLIFRLLAKTDALHRLPQQQKNQRRNIKQVAGPYQLQADRP